MTQWCKNFLYGGARALLGFAIVLALAFGIGWMMTVSPMTLPVLMVLFIVGVFGWLYANEAEYEHKREKGELPTDDDY